MPEGFLIVDKPSGITSHDVVAAVRRATGVRKVGHAGTLDPLATGVVVVAIGRVTRLIRFIQDFDKEYIATGVFGVATDSLDADGAVLQREEVDLDLEDVVAATPRFVGVISQVPPMVSALKVGGERLYEIARRGETIDRPPRCVEVHELEVTDFAPGPYPEVGFRIVCGKGTYIRSLVNDIAGALGTSAHLSALRRTRIGALDESRAIGMADLDSFEDSLLSPCEALTGLRQVAVDDDVATAVGHGAKFSSGPIHAAADEDPVVVVDGDARVLAVYRRTGREVKPEVVLA